MNSRPVVDQLDVGRSDISALMAEAEYIDATGLRRLPTGAMLHHAVYAHSTALSVGEYYEVLLQRLIIRELVS